MRATYTPFDKVLFQSLSIEIGRFWIPLGARQFPDTGAIQNHILVVPTWSVEITYSSRESIVADTTRVLCYNRGCEYRRRALNTHGDQCLWIAYDDERLADVLGGSPDAPFHDRALPLPRQAFLAARLLGASLLEQNPPDALHIEEQAWHLLGQCLDTHHTAPRNAPQQRRAIDRARTFIAEHYREPLTLANVADAACLSPYHLSRAFRRWTGISLHKFLVELRLRDSVQDVIDGERQLTDIAADLGFASPSHFSSSFRNAFGLAPSAMRATQIA